MFLCNSLNIKRIRWSGNSKNSFKIADFVDESGFNGEFSRGKGNGFVYINQGVTAKKGF